MLGHLYSRIRTEESQNYKVKNMSNLSSILLLTSSKNVNVRDTNRMNFEPDDALIMDIFSASTSSSH